MTRLRFRFLVAVAALCTVTAAAAGAPVAVISNNANAALAPQFAPRIAIIIDDLGYELAAGHRAIALPGPVTCAMLPAAPGTTSLARSANAQGKEILLHLPMQAANHIGKTEPHNITLDMSRRRFAETFEQAITSVPYAIGVNNHRGSLLTRHPGHMQWLMEEILERDSLFFIDSYTTHESIALQIAAESGVQALKRDVFLDSDPRPESVAREFERLKTLARKQGWAVAIGHPYEATLSHLEQALPRLADEGLTLVPLSELLVKQSIKVNEANNLQ